MAFGQPKVSIAVAAHKHYWMPVEPMYVPVQAGAMGKESIPGFRRDDEGDGGISALNPHLCELTVLYWAWKNLLGAPDSPSAAGLVHYRRHFAGEGERGVLSEREATQLLERAPVIVPNERNYYIESVGGHYDHTFDERQLDLFVQVVAELSPGCAPALYRRLTGKRAHMFNMFVMRADLLDAYCAWLFPIAERVESALDYECMTDFEARTPGRLAEFLLDSWLESEGVAYVERPVREMEPVNWAKKGSSFLAAKFLGRKYAASF